MAKSKSVPARPQLTIIKSPNAPPILIGYARVSTDEQSLEMQIDALRKAGCTNDFILVEKVSGVQSDRPALAEAISLLRPGDTFIVWKLDRMGRNLLDLLNRMTQIVDAGAHFKSLTETIDTSTPVGRLLFHVLGALASFERDLIIERTRAGMDQARREGRFPGAKRVLTDKQIEMAQRMRDRNVPVVKIAAKLGVTKPVVYKWTAGPRDPSRAPKSKK